MAIQGAINKLIGTAGAAVTLADKLGGKEEPSAKDTPSAKGESGKGGIDAKMAAKARKTAQQKIKTIQANKELTEKAKTRRIGKVLDEYIGGNK